MSLPRLIACAALAAGLASTGHAQQFDPPLDYPTSPAPTAATQLQMLATGDFNRDGRVDLVVTNYFEHKIYVLMQSSTTGGSFAPAVAYGPGSYPVQLAVADVNHDGTDDVAVAINGAPSVSLFLGDGDGGLGAHRDVPFWETPACVRIADMNRDGHPDIVASVGGSFNVAAGRGDGSFGPATSVSGGGGEFHIADANGDGALDLISSAAGYPTGDQIRTLLGDGNGGFGATIDSDLGTHASHNAIAIGDLNRDGRPDVVVPRYDQGGVPFFELRVLLGNRDGSFGAPALYDPGVETTPNSAAIADFDGDGHLDVACSAGDKVCVFRGRGDGTLEPSRLDFSLNKTAISIQTPDVNNDGRSDIVTANQGNVSVLLNRNSGGSAVPVASSQSVSLTSNTAKTIVLSATDADRDPLMYRIVTPPAHGTLSGAAPYVTYAPATDYVGSDSFTFSAYDGRSDSNPATVTITVNRPAEDPGNGNTLILYQVKITASSLYVRKGPSTDYDILGTLTMNDVVDVCELKDGRYRILYKGLTGWIAAKYASVLPSDEVRGGTPFCSPGNTGNPALAFDGALDTAFASSSRYDEYVGIDLGSSVRISKIVLWIGDPHRNYRAVLEGSNEGIDGSWHDLSGELNPPTSTSNYWLTVCVTDPSPYRWIRLRDDPYASNPILLAEMKIFGPDTTVPTVVGVSPVDGAVNVPFGDIVISFGESMDRPSVEAAFAVNPPVPGSFTWTQDPITRRDTLHFSASGWKSYTMYAVAVGSGAHDTWGNFLNPPLSISFTTNYRVPPVVNTLDPVPNGILWEKPARVTATFSRDLNPDSVHYLSFFLAGAGPDGVFDTKDDVYLQYAGVPTRLTSSGEAVIDTGILAMPPGLYRIRVRGGITDTLGNRLDGDFSGSFPSGNGEPGGDCVTNFVIGDPGNGSTTSLFRISVAADSLKVRCGPATSYFVVGAMNRDTVVSVYESKNGWYRILYNGTAGWISSKYASVVSNTAPTAANQGVTAAYNTSRPITLNATDPDGNPLTYRVMTLPAHGTLSGAAPNLSYTPGPDYAGADSFTFVANDGWLDSNLASVSITVSSPTGADGGNGNTTVRTRAAVSVSQTVAQTGPSTSYGAAGTLYQDAVVDVYEVKNGWYRIELNGQTAWILATDARTQVPLYPVKITSTTINVRSGPGTGYAILGQFPQNYIVDIYELQGGWCRIVHNGGTAWINASLTVKVPAPLFDAKVTVALLNVRTGPGSTYAIVGTLGGGSVVKVYATSGGWYKIIYGGYYRWINGTYTQKV